MYTLSALFHTDDDAELLYNGKSYCFYGDNLRISFRAPTIQECKEHLATISVTPGHKATNFVQQLIDDFIASDEMSVTYSGNQEIDIFITESKENETCNECRNGWCIMNQEENSFEIQRCDTCQKFETDEEATEAFLKEVWNL